MVDIFHHVYITGISTYVIYIATIEATLYKVPVLHYDKRHEKSYFVYEVFILPCKDQGHVALSSYHK